MRKRGLIVLAAVGLLGMVSLLLLNRYKTDIVHVTILNAVLQKAPPNYTQDRIRKRFDDVWSDAREAGSVEAHLRRLLALAQRLEKIQSLDAMEVDLLLEDLDRDPLPQPPEGSDSQKKG